MGTDIHLFVHVKQADGSWVYAPDAIPEGARAEARNYPLFAILADVRNGFGFAGSATHDPVDPLFAGRGLPPDFAVDDYVGEHSFTYATAAELYAVPWDLPYHMMGYIRADDYAEFKASGRPSRYYADIWCPDILKLTEEDFRHYTADTTDVYVHIDWTATPIADCTFRRWLNSEPMLDLVEQYGAKNVRVTMGFDS